MKLNDVSQIIYRALDVMNSQNVRKFSVPPRTYMGPGSLACTGDAMKSEGFSRTFIMVDAFIHNIGIVDGLYRSLNVAGIDYELHLYEGGEPTSDAVEKAAQQLLTIGCDSVIAIGGGSVLDAAKITAVLAANSNLSLDHLLDGNNQLNKRLPLVAIPTTAGTGSEATDISVITNTKTNIKQVLVHDQLIPDLAIIDACLTLALPPYITAITGFDALTHGVETYVGLKSTPLTKGFAYRAISMIGEALPHAVGQGQNIEAREALMLASYMAGMAFSNAGLGLSHATAHQIGAKYHIPHGQCNAIMLPAIMRFNSLVCKKEYAEIGLALTGKNLEAPETIIAIESLIDELGLKESPEKLGLNSADIPELSKAAFEDACLITNPRSTTIEQIQQVYADAFSN